MTGDAIQHLLIIACVCGDLTNQFSMTTDTIFLQNDGVVRLDADRFGEILQGKCAGVVIPIGCFGKVLAEDVVWHMAIVTGRYGLVARLLPAIVLLAHDMTIDTGFGVIREIGEPLSVIECVARHPRKDAKRGTQG